MVGLVILVALALYLAISIGVVRWAVRWAKRKGRRPILCGILAGLVMYNLVFWDLIPTYAVYKYYCITKAGFWVYKTPEQWKAENPGVAETLTWREQALHYEKYDEPGIKAGYRLNERIVWIRKENDFPIIPVGISEQIIVDLKTNQTLVRLISANSGNVRETITRFWTHFGPCLTAKDSKDFGRYITAYEKLGRARK